MSAPRTRELSLYDGQDLIGTIKVAVGGKVIAFDSRGKRLGSFTSLKAASAAFDPSIKRPARRITPGAGRGDAMTMKIGADIERYRNGRSIVMGIEPGGRGRSDGFVCRRRNTLVGRSPVKKDPIK